MAFKSPLFDNFGQFYNSLNAKWTPNTVPVCYGGIFAASVTTIYKQDMEMWKKLEKLLERGDNIQEGHYAERSWARLLSTPLKPYQIKSIRNHSTGIQELIFSIHGPLIRERHETDLTFMNLNEYREIGQSTKRHQGLRFVSAV